MVYTEKNRKNLLWNKFNEIKRGAGGFLSLHLAKSWNIWENTFDRMKLWNEIENVEQTS